jgi:hypothetical protein
MMIRRRRCFTNESREASARSSARDRRTPTAHLSGRSRGPSGGLRRHSFEFMTSFFRHR